MLDGVLAISQIINLAKRSRRVFLLLKVNFEKAYDNVSWNYLRSVMRAMSFGARWMKWMEGSIFF